MATDDFHGAKAALFFEDSLLVLRRDRAPATEWAGAIDLPGGGREGQESPSECILREIAEETGLRLTDDCFFFRTPRKTQAGWAWFFAAQISAEQARSAQLGDEGEALWFVPVAEYLASDETIPHHRASVLMATRYLGSPHRSAVDWRAEGRRD